MKRVRESETTPNSSACAFASLAWVSKPPKETDHTFVGDPAAINLETTSSCWAKLLSPPAFPPLVVGRSGSTGAGAFKIGCTLVDTLKRLRIDVAAAAINLESFFETFES